jgi:hypothetical protein
MKLNVKLGTGMVAYAYNLSYVGGSWLIQAKNVARLHLNK